MSSYLKDIVTGAYSLITGLGVTIKAFVNPIVTVQYPRATIPIPPRFRGHTELIRDPETGTTRCIVCGMCEKNCPSGCIKVYGEKPEGAKRKVLTKYLLNFTTCSLCGICVEICPTKALTFSNEYNLAGFSREDFHYDLLQRLKSMGETK